MRLAGITSVVLVALLAGAPGRARAASPKSWLNKVGSPPAKGVETGRQAPSVAAAEKRARARLVKLFVGRDALVRALEKTHGLVVVKIDALVHGKSVAVAATLVRIDATGALAPVHAEPPTSQPTGRTFLLKS